MRFQNLSDKRLRSHGALGVIVVVIGVLVVQFFRVQVLRSGDYKLRSESNRLRPVSVHAPRGTVFDRYGNVIADNIPGYAVYVLRESKESTREVLNKLAPHLNLSREKINNLMEDVRRHEPLLVDADVDFAAISVLEEQINKLTSKKSIPTFRAGDTLRVFIKMLVVCCA